MGHSRGQLTNYANIARDCGVDAKTVNEYYQILVDTLLATRVEPFKRRQDRQDLRSLVAFVDEFHPKQAIVVCNESIERLFGGVKIMPWRSFLRSLWGRDIL